MTALELMREETQGNTDIAAPTWAAMRIEVAARIEQDELKDWICEEVA